MNRGRILVGGGLMVLGLLFLLDAVDVISAGAIIRDWWPVVIILAGLLQLLDRPRNTPGGVTLIVIGVVILTVTTDFVGANVFQIALPIGLVLLGLWIVFGRPGARGTSTGEDTVEATVLFSGRDLKSDARPFRGGSLLAMFGGIELDLSQAQLDPEGAMLDASAAFGGIDITVPPDWRVQMSGPGIFGAFEDQTHKEGLAPGGAPVLTVRGVALFGGVEVKLPKTGWMRQPSRSEEVGREG